jgi:hypothetical protein
VRLLLLPPSAPRDLPRMPILPQFCQSIASHPSLIAAKSHLLQLYPTPRTTSPLTSHGCAPASCAWARPMTIARFCSCSQSQGIFPARRHVDFSLPSLRPVAICSHILVGLASPRPANLCRALASPTSLRQSSIGGEDMLSSMFVAASALARSAASLVIEK